MGKQKPEFPQGTFDMLVLKALSLGPTHGYGVGQRIQRLADELLNVEEGTLYPALYRIEQAGWIDSEWGLSENNRRAKFYRMTRKGRRQLERETSKWDRLARAIGRILRPAEE